MNNLRFVHQSMMTFGEVYDEFTLEVHDVVELDDDLWQLDDYLIELEPNHVFC